MILKEAPGPGPEQEFRSYLSEGRFMIQRSRSSGRYVFFPRVAEPGSGRSDLEWVEASGFGTVYSITVNRTREGSYNIALIELDEGPRLMSRVEGVETVPIGTRVKARITEIDGEPAVVFDVVREGGAA
jgi:hypothetical protein|nr:MAG: nucleic acid-binding protein [Pseudomonadota bacterium]